MLTLELATTQQHYEELLNLVCHQNISSLAVKFDWIQLTCEQFGAYFRTTGTAYRLCLDRRLVGLCWVGEMGRTLYVYGIIVQPELQGQGLGRQALDLLQDLYQERMDAIELSVHASNPRAKALYERLNFKVVCYQEDTGFYLMRKQCRHQEREGLTMDIPIGKVTHYYTRIGVAVLSLTGELKIGDTILILGHTTDFTQKVGSLEIEHKQIPGAAAGMEVALKVAEPVRRGDGVFQVTEEQGETAAQPAT